MVLNYTKPPSQHRPLTFEGCAIWSRTGAANSPEAVTIALRKHLLKI